ncbi:MAG: M28 family peptidase [Erysipelotrichaceae bacterium]|nr:M28 family peptidase [Erysipelotrichaceae bacterium]
MYKSFDLLKKLYFVRTGGSKEELLAANIIADECRSLGASVAIEEFKVDGYEIKNTSLTFNEPNISVECVGVGMSGSTPLEGLTGDFTYVTSVQDAEIQDIEGKVCLVHSKLVNYKLYKRLAEKKALALVLCCGDVYRDKDDVDLDPYMYRDRHYQNGKIPAVCIRMKDAENILRAMPKSATVVNVEQELENASHNVVATVEGTDKKNEIIAFTAHYDSVSYSKGSYDNATGSTAIMQLLAYFMEHKPQRTLKFIWCGSEEMGLLGSKAYVRDHKDELSSYKLCINVDMIGVTIGNDIACCTANQSLVSYIKYLGCEVGFAITSRQGVYSSDSTPFADGGVPAVSFARLAPQGGAQIHSRRDVIDYLEEGNYYKTCDFISLFASRLINSKAFPVEMEIPEKMKEELDYYLGRKEKKE